MDGLFNLICYNFFMKETIRKVTVISWLLLEIALALYVFDTRRNFTVESPKMLDISGKDLSVKTGSYLVFDQKTGKILSQQNMNKKVGIASTTKLLSMYLVLDAIDSGKITWDTPLSVSNYAYALTQDSEVANVTLNQEEKYKVRELYKAALIESANSAPVMLAEGIAGSEPKFVDMMRKKLRDFGIKDAHIINSSGLNNSLLGGNIYPGSKEDDENYMSARDMGLVVYHLLKDHPEIVKTTKEVDASFNDDQELITSNMMLEGMSMERSGIDGLKTGTTTYAGQCFIARSIKPYSLVSLVFKADDGLDDGMARFRATDELLNRTYASFTPDKIQKNQENLPNLLQ